MRFAFIAVVLISFASASFGAKAVCAQDYDGVYLRSNRNQRSSNETLKGQFPARVGNVFRVNTRSNYPDEPVSRLDAPQPQRGSNYEQTAQPIAAPMAPNWDPTFQTGSDLSPAYTNPQADYRQPTYSNGVESSTPAQYYYEPENGPDPRWSATDQYCGSQEWPSHGRYPHGCHPHGHYPYVNGNIFGVGRNECCDEWAGHCQCLELTNSRSNCECTNPYRTKRPQPQRVRAYSDCGFSDCDRSAEGSTISDYFHPKTRR